ncbi:DUF3558 family protein [Dietzia aurantiaca]|uniref:DUF3558 family protein n=1 Tax=Dietzia aurantiaca TaxID=983873 RepID=A0ABV9PRM5_9ACTN
MLVAAVMVLSGCASATEDVTTTSPSPETPVNPWDLPLEERPDLFDPCAEIPVEAVEEGVGLPLEVVEQFQNYKPGELISCGWKTDEVHVSLLSTWKSREEFLADSTVSVIDADSNATGRPSLRMQEAADSTNMGCLHLFFTEVGAVMYKMSLVTSLEQFKGERFVDSCDALDQAIKPVISRLPQGDF